MRVLFNSLKIDQNVPFENLFIKLSINSHLPLDEKTVVVFFLHFMFEEDLIYSILLIFLSPLKERVNPFIEFSALFVNRALFYWKSTLNLLKCSFEFEKMEIYSILLLLFLYLKFLKMFQFFKFNII